MIRNTYSVGVYVDSQDAVTEDGAISATVYFLSQGYGTHGVPNDIS